MAYTATLVKTDVKGSERTATYLVTADAASGSVSTNMGTLNSAFISPVSMATSAGKIKINTTVASAASLGVVFVSSVANGDVFYLMCFGKS